ncbi:LysM peptidoglycan-binding domain-containing protein [Fulvivirga sp. M361]|uniref:lytic transglycosylase domain-containing protein n=1 Tax=Fulvivirga sp. M361 TaxID=2594266 RepID=UPI001179C479|nr:lytic transglycosylase domain-containing protein [Fulvivirga sp. M361]TRX55570.1 LysM peptidoglycan-binding domain-containing protein [Fulvivirga sp. M361]
MKLLIFLTAIFPYAGAEDSTVVQQDSTVTYFTPVSDYEYIPAEIDYDLVRDRLSCIQKEIPLNYTTKVHAFVNYFAVKDRAYTHLMLQRKNVYFPLFEKYLKKYGLPDELKYLSIIESGLNPKAVSRARAVGLWQFMSSTGKSYDLHQDWYIDERMDPEKSTEAACRFLKQLYNMFGNWELAIAAYNTGPGNVRKAIRRSGYKRTFWEIYPYLYRETRSYLPQFVAILYVFNYAEEHNFLTEDMEYLVASDTISTGSYIHLETLANQLNLCKEDIEKLNPGLKRGAIPSIKGGYTFRIPKDAKVLLQANRATILDSAGKTGKKRLEQLAKNSVGSTYNRDRIVYRVKSGDVLGTIAERYRVRVSDIKRWNNLRGSTIRVGQRLNIWRKPGTYQAIAKKEADPITQSINGIKTYVVQPGDTLWDISRKFNGLSIEKLKKMNRLQTNKIKPGQQLIIGG